MKMIKVLSTYLRGYIILGALLVLVSPVSAQTGPVWRVDDQGNLTVNGEIFHVRGGSWTGLEGRSEPDDDPYEHSLAPMEMYMGNMWWAESGRTYEQDINEFKAMGFNLIRLPIVHQTLDPNHPDGRAPNLKNAEPVRIGNSRLALETVIQLLDDAGIYVLLDIHSCSNYVGWRAGRLDARPPYVDDEWENWDFYRDGYSCAAANNPPWVIIHAYDTTKWLSDLRTLAGLGAELGVTNIMGIDIFNEPWDYTWDEWRSMIDQAYEAVDAVNPDILIFAQGISNSAGNQDGTPETVTRVPHGAEETNPNWGENLYEAGLHPPSMPKNRLVFSPHTFGPSVFVQKMFMDPNQPWCEGREGDEAGDNGCNIVINPTLLEHGWEEHFGYLKELGYAIVIGAFGGNPDWPENAQIRYRERYDYLTDSTVDWQWQNAFADYLNGKDIRDAIYRAINPEHLDTGGIYEHAYDPIVNKSGWGTWLGFDQRKIDVLHRIWDGHGDPPPTPEPKPPLNSGDVNGNNSIDIVDALLTAQYYVDLTPAVFIPENADVNCDGSITIVDALLIARYYAGLLGSFNCS